MRRPLTPSSRPSRSACRMDRRAASPSRMSIGSPISWRCICARSLASRPAIASRIQMPNCLAYPIAVFGVLKAGLVMVNTNPLYTPPEMVHQFADSGAIGLIVIDLFATRSPRSLPKTAIQTVMVVTHCRSAAAVKRARRARRAEICEEDDPPITFAHVTFRAGAGRRARDRIATGADPQGLRARARPRQHRRAAIHRRHHRRREGRRRSRTAISSPTSSRASRCGSRC